MIAPSATVVRTPRVTTACVNSAWEASGSDVRRLSTSLAARCPKCFTANRARCSGRCSGSAQMIGSSAGGVKTSRLERSELPSTSAVLSSPAVVIVAPAVLNEPSKSPAAQKPLVRLSLHPFDLKACPRGLGPATPLGRGRGPLEGGPLPPWEQLNDELVGVSDHVP
jgi:hypothetical protein